MCSSPYGCLLVAVWLGAAAPLAGAAEQPPSGGDKKPGPSETLPPPAGVKKIEPLKLPAEAVVVVYDQLTDAMKAVPKAVVLSPEKFQDLLDEIARLKAQIKPRPTPPAKVRLKGKVEGGLVTLQAQFDFHADHADAVFALGCGQAKALSAQQNDGRTPLLSWDPDGFLVQVEKPGDYQLTLDLSLPTVARGTGRGFELDLPRAVVTILDLDLPPDARGPRLGGADVSATSVALKGTKLDGPLGAADKLDVTWLGAPPSGANPVQTARGRIQVRVEEGQMTTDAELVLRVQGAPVSQWVLLTPPGAEVKVAPGDQGRVQSIAKADEPFVARHTIILKELSDKDLTVLVGVRAPLPRGGRAPVGPFVVRGATRQTGVVLLSSAVPDIRTRFQRQGDLTEREITEEERRKDPALTNALEYLDVAPLNKPLLEIEVETLRGLIKAQTTHVLSLVRTGAESFEWHVTTTIEASPQLRTGVDHLEVLLPPECEYQAPPAAANQSVEWNEKTRVLQFKLADKPSGAFTVALEGKYSPAVTDKGDAVLPLPRPLETRDGGGQIDVAVPEDVELSPPADTELTTKQIHKQSWHSARTPVRAPLDWKPYHPVTRATAVVDLTLTGASARVEQELRFHFPRPVPDEILLRTPPAVSRTLRVEGGELLPANLGTPAVRSVKKPADLAGQDWTLKLQYTISLLDEDKPRDADRPFAVPMAWPEAAVSGETKVRVWCDPGSLPRPAPDGAWQDANIEEVKGVNRLPVLVLRAERLDAPLSLLLEDAGGAPLATVLVERALFRATPEEGGAWKIQASYRLGQLATRDLDIDLPGPVVALNLKVKLDDKDVAYETVDDAGQRDERGQSVRLRLNPDLVRPTSVLDVTYHLSPGRSGGYLWTTLPPPLLRGDPGQAPTRWLVALPPESVPVGPEDGPGTPLTVGWQRGWLPAPQLALTEADLERWFSGADSPTAVATTPDLVCWQDSRSDLTVLYARQWAWLLASSVGLLAVGGLLIFLARKALAGRLSAAVLFWLLAALLVLALGAVWLTRPLLLWNILYGCQPGAAVLALVLAALWVMHERYRRQIVFLPNFRRARSGSSLVRHAAAAARPHGEPSTVDAPRPASSQK